jgi:hypothetical protein
MASLTDDVTSKCELLTKTEERRALPFLLEFDLYGATSHPSAPLAAEGDGLTAHLRCQMWVDNLRF